MNSRRKASEGPQSLLSSRGPEIRKPSAFDGCCKLGFIEHSSARSRREGERERGEGNLKKKQVASTVYRTARRREEQMEQSEAARLNVECLGEGKDEARQGSQCLDKRTQDMRISLLVVNWYNASPPGYAARPFDGFARLMLAQSWVSTVGRSGRQREKD